MMSEMPAHVRAAVAPVPKQATTRASPYRPYVSRRYPLPVWQWALLYGPPIFLASVMLAAGLRAVVVDPSDGLSFLFGVLAMNCLLIGAAAYRIPQERRRARARHWTEDPNVPAYRWHDPSGEWRYARFQNVPGLGLVRWAVAVAMPATWMFAISQSSSGWTWLVITFVTAALVYVHRHLPTKLRHVVSFRACETCGKVRPANTFRLCDRCGRIAPVVHYLALPSLQRRWRDL